MTDFNTLLRQTQAALPALRHERVEPQSVAKVMEAINQRWAVAVRPVASEVEVLTTDTDPTDVRSEILPIRDDFGYLRGAEQRIEVEWSTSDERVVVAYGFRYQGYAPGKWTRGNAQITIETPTDTATLFEGRTGPIFIRDRAQPLDGIVEHITARALHFGPNPLPALHMNDVSAEVLADGPTQVSMPGAAFLDLPAEDVLSATWPITPIASRPQLAALFGEAAEQIRQQLSELDRERPLLLGSRVLAERLPGLEVCAHIIDRHGLKTEARRQMNAEAKELPQRMNNERRLSVLIEHIDAAIRDHGDAESTGLRAKAGMDLLQSALPLEHVRFALDASRFGRGFEFAGRHDEAIGAYQAACDSRDARPSKYDNNLDDGISIGRNLRLAQRPDESIEHLKRIQPSAARIELAGVHRELFHCHIALGNETEAHNAQRSLASAAEAQLKSYRSDGTTQNITKLFVDIFETNMAREDYKGAMNIGVELGKLTPLVVGESETARGGVVRQVMDFSKALRQAGRPIESLAILDTTAQTLGWRTPEALAREQLASVLDAGYLSHALVMLNDFNQRFPADQQNHGYEFGFGASPPTTDADDWHLAIDRNDFVTFVNQRITDISGSIPTTERDREL
jgi:hypothetical protein